MAENEDFSYGSRKTVKRSRQTHTHTHSLKSNWILQKFLFVFATVGKTKRDETLLNRTRAKKRVTMEGEDNNKKETVNESSRERHYNTYRYFTLLIEEIKKCTTVVVAIVFCGC